jgi:hypothetical protein
MLDYIGSRREMEEWTSVPFGSPWNTTKLQGSHMTTEQTNRRQEQEFRLVLKRGGFADLGKRQGKCKGELGIQLASISFVNMTEFEYLRMI